jgi:hypothetical protein
VRELFSFTNPVDEKAARTVAFVVMLASAVGVGLVPERVCPECAEITGHIGRAHP